MPTAKPCPDCCACATCLQSSSQDLPKRHIQVQRALGDEGHLAHPAVEHELDDRHLRPQPACQESAAVGS